MVVSVVRYQTFDGLNGDAKRGAVPVDRIIRERQPFAVLTEDGGEQRPLLE
jgi:hypothetical protein